MNFSRLLAIATAAAVPLLPVAAQAQVSAAGTTTVVLRTTSSSWSVHQEDLANADITGAVAPTAGYVYPPGDPNYITTRFFHNSHVAPYRTGYYDAASDKGWGRTKVERKHQITDVKLLSDGYALATQQRTSSNRFVTRFLAVLQDSKGDVVDQRIVRIVTDEVDKRADNETVGVITAYCENPGDSCPSWVNNY